MIPFKISAGVKLVLRIRIRKKGYSIYTSKEEVCVANVWGVTSSYILDKNTSISRNDKLQKQGLEIQHQPKHGRKKKLQAQ